MTDHERQIMHDHHIAMRRTCLAQAAEHEKMAKVYEGPTRIVLDPTPEALSALMKLGDPANMTPGAIVRLSKEEFAAIQEFERIRVNTSFEPDGTDFNDGTWRKCEVL